MCPSQCIMRSMWFIIGNVKLDHLAKVVSVVILHNKGIFFLYVMDKYLNRYFETMKYLISPQILMTNCKHQLVKSATIWWCLPCGGWFFFISLTPFMFISWIFLVRKRHCFSQLHIYTIMLAPVSAWHLPNLFQWPQAPPYLLHLFLKILFIISCNWEAIL